MKLRYSNFKYDFQRVLIVTFLVLPFFSVMNFNPSKAALNAPLATIETIDLGISRNITITNRLTVFTLQKSLHQLVNGNQEVFAVFMVHNTGQELKKITVTVTIDNYEWEQVFCRVEDLLDVYYDFSLTNELVLPLVELNMLPEITSFNISFALEYYLSVSEIFATFQLLNTKIVQVSDVPTSDVFRIPHTFSLRLSASESLQYRNRFVLNTYYLTNIPPQNIIYVTLHLHTTLQIESLTLLGATMTNTNEASKNFHKVEMILDKNLTKVGLKLKMTEVSEVTEGEITLEVDSVYLSPAPSDFGEGFFREIDLPTHPIPEELMFILLMLVLFGVPLYVVYKHQEVEAKKRLNILGEK